MTNDRTIDTNDKTDDNIQKMLTSPEIWKNSYGQQVLAFSDSLGSLKIILVTNSYLKNL